MSPTAQDTELSGRALSPFEAISAVVCETTVMSARVTGAIDQHALAAAWAVLLHENPVLSATIGFGPEGLVLTAGQGPTAPISSGRVSPVDMTTTPIMFGQPVAGLDVNPLGVDEHWVSLVTHHAIADGILLYHWFTALWRTYTERVNGAPPTTVEPQPFPASPEMLLAERGVGKGTRTGAERLDGVVVYPFRDPVGRSAGRDPLALHRVVRVLSVEATTALRTTAKERNSTVHGLICGAILLAERELLAVDDAVPVGLISHVNIRTRLEPPVTNAEGTNVIGYSCVQVNVAPDDDPAAIGDEVLSALHTDLADGVVQQTCLHIPEIVARWASGDSLEPISVSNIGEFAPLPLPDGLAVLDFHLRGNANYAVLAGANPPEDLPLSTGRHHAVFSYGGRLHLQTLYPAAVLTPEDAEALGTRIAGLLTALTQEA